MFLKKVKKSRGGQTINSSQKRRENYLRRKKIGAILIEFAFSIPVFLILMYYIHDLPKMKLMQRRNQFAANILAATIQNISKQRQFAGQNLTKNDIKDSIRLSMLAVFPGMTQYSQGEYYHFMPNGFMPMVHLFVFSGIGSNIASRKFWYRFYPQYGQSREYAEYNAYQNSIVDRNETSASKIYPEFQISAGEMKCIIDVALYNDDLMKFGTSGPATTTVSKKELFGFLFYTPQSRAPSGCTYFNAVTIFTPIWKFDNDLQ